MPNKILEFANIKIGYLSLNPTIHFSSNCIKSREMKNKIAVTRDESSSAYGILKYRTAGSWKVKPGAKLFVSPDCKLPRDLYRNSGFSLTRDKDNADFIVFPGVPDIKTIDYDILCKDKETNDLYAIKLWNRHNPSLPWFTDIYARIKTYFSGCGYDMEYYTDAMEYSTDYHRLDIVPDYPVYREIIEASNASRYIEETDVPVTPPVNINVETLTVWKHTDDTLLQQAIISSDWKDYPFTLLVFLLTEKPNALRSYNSAYSFILSKIGYNRYVSSDKMLEGRRVEPKDWNMLQDWVMKVCNVSENGGRVVIKNPDAYEYYSRFVRQSLYIAPIRTTEAIDYTNLRNIS